MRNSGRFLLLLSLAVLMTNASVGAQDDYPPGTLTPTLDLNLQTVEVKVPEQFRDNVPEGLTLNVPPGFSVSVFMAGLRNPRLMVFDDNGVLHVGNMGRGQILALPDRDQDGIADESIVALSGLVEGHSLVFYKGDLYVGEENQIIRARDNDGDLVYEEKEVFISDIPWEGWHDTRTIVFDETNEKLYVSVGSPCDLCRMEEGLQVVGNSSDLVPFSPERGTILQFNADGTGRRIFATGVRNVIGMAFHPVTNELWGNNNGHDLEGRTRPPEWIDVIRDNDFMGYPLVQSHQVWNDFAIPEYQKLLPITREDSLLAARQKKPAGLVPAHYAPMGLHFYTGDQFPEMYKNAAFVAFRAGKAKLSSHPGYNVSALFSDADGSNGRIGEFISGFQTGTTQNSVWGFPVGLTTDQEGSLYVTSDRGAQLILKVMSSPISGSWQHNLPAAVAVGAALAVQATVQVERLDGGGGPLQVTADLSALGGPAALPLVDEGDNMYRLDTRLELGDLPNGVYRLRVRVEQEINGKLRNFDFTETISIVPPDLAILDDALLADWQLVGDKGAQVLGNTAAGPVFHGEKAMAVQVAPPSLFAPWTLDLVPPQTVARFGFAGLRFAFHPGDTEAPQLPILRLSIDGIVLDLTDLAQVGHGFQLDLERRQWQVREIPFTAFDQRNYNGPGLRDSVDAVAAVRLEGNLKGTFYLDDVRLVTAIPSLVPAPVITAVLHGQSEALPGSFALAQNYPNPFNSETVIRYALPQETSVDLTVYNMVGQEVAKLVYGRREAGVYSVHWDGRDNADRELATGMYVYRLRAGERTLARKLLLLH